MIYAKRCSNSSATYRRVLEKTHWNQTIAARMLGIHRNTLLGKIEQLELR